MKITVCEFPDELDRKEAAWTALVDYVGAVTPDVVVLPEMPFCAWIFSSQTVDLDLWRLAVAMMFPEHARDIGMSSARLIAQPRAGGSGRHWRVASEMSAIVSGCYVASANRRSHERDWFAGQSWVLSPQAHVLAETNAETPFVTASIDLAVADLAKTHYPRDLQRMYRGMPSTEAARVEI
jgi:hypothetical protein